MRPIFGPQIWVQFWGAGRALLVSKLRPDCGTGPPIFFYPCVGSQGQGCVICSKALVWLQWAKAVSKVAGKRPLFINMDETSVAYSFVTGKGLVISKKALPPGKRRRKQKVSLAEEKRRISLLACVTDDPEVQPKLPQVFLGNESTFTKELLKQLAPHTPANYHLLRGNSSWNNHARMRALICSIAKSLEGYKATRQIILVLDMAQCHIHQSINALAARKGIRLLYVPAKCTWLLQPADTHCFAILKGKLRQEWVALRAASSTGTISHKDWLCAVMSIVKTLLNGTKWASAFKSAGLLGEAKLSQRVMDQLGWPAPKPIPDVLPSESQLKVAFPKKCKFSRSSLFSWSAAPMPKAKGKAKAKAMAAPMLD